MSAGFSVNQIEQLLNSTKSKWSFKNFDLCLYMISYLLEDKSNEKVIIAYINKSLKSLPNDEEVYKCLIKIVSCVSTEALFENILFWIQHIVDNSKNNKENSKRFAVISNLIEVGKNNQDFNKLILSSLLFKIIEECLLVEIESFHIGDALACLATCLETYPSSCGSMKNKIESYLLQFLFLKTTNLRLINKAALCFQRLQKIGSPGLESINYKNNWKNAFGKLCATMDTLHDNFFEGVDEFCSHEKMAIDPYILPDLPKVISSTEMLYVVENRLQNTCLFLKGMLEYQFCVPKCIYPQYVIDIITRVLSIHICINNKTDSKNLFHFSILLLKHQVTILYFLRSLIAVLELNLLQFSATISKLLIDSLGRTQNCNCFKHASEYKEALYKVLEYWINVLRNCLNFNVHDKMVNLIIDDISPIIADVSLNISDVDSSTSKKAKKKAMQAKIVSSSTKRSNLENCAKNLLDVREKVCYQALCCLSTLLNNVCLSVKDNTLLLLYNTLTRAILSIQNGSATFPYDTDNIKLKLFEALLAAMECSKPPSIGLIVNLLKEGQRSSNSSISLTCFTGLNLLEKICQPVCPSWNFCNQTQSTRNSNEAVIKSMEKEELPPLLRFSGDYQIQKEIVEGKVELETLSECSTIEYDDFEQENGSELETKDDTVTISQTSEEQDEVEKKQDVVIEKQEIEYEQNRDNKEIEQRNKKENDKEVIEKKDIEQAMQVEDAKLNGNTSINETNIENDSNNCLVESDCAEPVQKKLKKDTSLSDPDINDMLAAFVDAVSENL